MSKMPKKTGCTASTSRNSSRTYPIFKISGSKNTTFNNVVFISQNYLSSISSSYAYLPISFFSFGLFRLFRLLHFEFRKNFLTRLYSRTPHIFEKKFYAIRPRHSKDFSKSFLNGRIFLYIDNQWSGRCSLVYVYFIKEYNCCLQRYLKDKFTKVICYTFNSL